MPLNLALSLQASAQPEKREKNSHEERVMADYLSGSINFQGLGSGTDFGSIIAQLKKIESIPMQRMEIWKADWQARALAFETVLQSMRDAKAALSLIDSRDKCVTKLAVSSKPDIAAVSATGKALDGTHSIEVTQLASNAIWSCGTEFASRTASISTQNTQFTYTYKGQTRTLQIAGNTGLESFVNMVNNDPQNKGIRASIVQSGSGFRLQIQGKDSGKDATLDIAPTAGLNFISDPAWRSSQSYAGSEAVWGSGVGAGQFKYTLGFGAEQTIAVTNSTTVNDLISAINGASGAGTAALDGDGRLVITGATSVKGPATADTIGATYWTSSKAYGANEALVGAIKVWKSAASFADPTDLIPTGVGEFSITVNGTTRTVALDDPAIALQDLVAKINSAGFGNIASAEAIGGNPANGYVLRIDGADGSTGGSSGASLAGSSMNDTRSFSFTIGAETFSLDLVSGSDTARDLVSAVNEAYRAAHPGAADVASLVQNSSGRHAVQIAGASSTSGAGINGASAQAANGFNITPLAWTSQNSFASAGDIAVASPQTFAFSLNGTDHTVGLAAGSSAQDVVDAINTAAGSAVAELVADPRDGSRLVIRLNGASVSQSAQLEGTHTIARADAAASGSGLPGGFAFGGWVVQEPRNATFRLDNWPDELESTSNNISGVLDGVTITIFDLGKSQISIATDTESVEQSIQTFLDAVNSVRLAIRELSKVDDSTSGYNFSVAKKDDNSPSKKLGSVLTGNYGVQLLSSRMRELAAGMPPGFQKILGSDLFTGDLISSLSQIGIKTVSDKDDPNYGLLVIAPPSGTSGMQDMDMRAFDGALSTKLDALLDFFACDDEGSSSSADFRYASHVKGGTKAGTYNVEYTVSYDAATPGVPIIEVYIDGKKAARDSSMEGYWFTSASGPSAGLAIQIDNLNEGAHSGKVSIKQGKIREMEDFFTMETRSYDDINHTGGALEVLKRNYANIMENIDKRIEREQTRINRWEQTQKLAFARLDTLLAKYNANQQRLESEIAKLGSSTQ
jgi:flagellar hook-associated protein 2